MCQVLGIQIGIRHSWLQVVYQIVGKMDRSTVGCDMLLVYSVIHCIRYGTQPPHGKK